MALADQLLTAANQSVTKTADIKPGDAIAQGVQLAQAQERIDLQRQQLEGQRQLVEAQKDRKIFDKAMNIAKIRNPKMRRVMMKGLEKEAEAYGRPLSPEFVEGFNAIDPSPELASQALNEYNAAMEESIQLGRPTERLARARAVVSSTLYGGDLTELQKIEEQEQRARIVQEAAQTRQQTQIQASAAEREREFSRTAQKKLAGEAAKNYAAYKAEGGRAGLEVNLENLEKAVKKLESKEVTTGGISTKVPGLNSDAVQSILNQEMRNVENDARAAIMPLLRATLGAQFTDKEGERIFNTVFDPKAPPKENARRIKNKIKELKATLADKETLFREQGLLTESDTTTRSTQQSEAQSIVTGKQTRY